MCPASTLSTEPSLQTQEFPLYFPHLQEEGSHRFLKQAPFVSVKFTVASTKKMLSANGQGLWMTRAAPGSTSEVSPSVYPVLVEPSESGE